MSLQSLSPPPPPQASRLLAEAPQAIYDIKAWQDQDNFCRNTREKSEAELSNLPPGITTVIKKVPSLFYENQEYLLELYSTQDFVSVETERLGFWARGQLERAGRYFNMYAREHNIPLSNLTFVDIGAHVGTYTFALADLGVNVIAIEPMPQNVQILRRTLCRNPRFADRVVIHPVALSRRPGKSCAIYSDKNNIGDGHVICDRGNTTSYKWDPYQLRADSVKMVRLDDLLGQTLKHHQHLVFLKMDVEGFEADVVEGGAMLFRSGRVTLIQLEYGPVWIREKGGDPEKMLSILFKAGYQLRLEDTPDLDMQVFKSEAIARGLKDIHQVLFEIV